MVSQYFDIYASYKEMTVYEQANLDASQSFKESVTPVSLLVALTPEEKKDTIISLVNRK